MNQNKRPDTFSLVRDIYAEHQDWNAKQVYDRYKILIGNPDLAVTLNAVQKQLEKLKAESEKPEYQELEQPWNIGLSSKYTFLTPEQIHLITEMQGYIKLNPKYNLSVRQALWMVRISGFAKTYLKKLDFKKVKPELRKTYKNEESYMRNQFINYLCEMSLTYAFYETKWQLSGKPLPSDTSVLDSELVKGNLILSRHIKETGEDTIYSIADLYSDNNDDIKDLVSFDKKDGAE